MYMATCMLGAGENVYTVKKNKILHACFRCVTVTDPAKLVFVIKAKAQFRRCASAVPNLIAIG